MSAKKRFLRRDCPMTTTDIWLEVEDHQQIRIKKWTNETSYPKAIVQLAHGMAEHIDRYDPFATFLLNHNVFVYGNDHRGHGRTGEKAGMKGHFADTNGFSKATGDLHTITNLIKRDFPDVPILLLGHSMGSFLVRRYIQRYSHDINGIILSGTGSHPGIANSFGKLLAKIEIKRSRPLAPSKFLNRLAFGSYNKRISNNKTEFDWLTRDEKQVQSYLNDPDAGFVPTASFFFDLFTGLDMIHNRAEMENIREDLPVLFISGDQDPVGNYAKGVNKVIDSYKKMGIRDIDSHFYKDGRHEMLNELNKEEVYQDIWNWIKKKF
jgi:alpha-beta hydrolase superfamily lysophospholipase